MLRNILVCKSIFVLVDYKKVCDFFLGPPFRKTVVDDFFSQGRVTVTEVGILSLLLPFCRSDIRDGLGSD